jgi:hypothetical protein
VKVRSKAARGANLQMPYVEQIALGRPLSNPRGLTFDIIWLEDFEFSFAIEISVAAFSARPAVRKFYYSAIAKATIGGLRA